MAELSDFDRGLLVGRMIGEGSFGGDGKQPQITLRMHVRHEALFRWLMDRFPDTRLYGPYPWRTLTVAYGPDLVEEGIEYPNLIFQGPDRGHLLTAHEVAHQWFYSLVGNNQARDPWLDEGLASWAGAEASDDMPVFANVPIPADVGGRLGQPMTFWDRHGKEYFAGVYGQGVQALQSLGSTGRIECALRRYTARNAYRIATDRDLIAAFSTVFPQAREQLARYGVR